MKPEASADFLRQAVVEGAEVLGRFYDQLEEREVCPSYSKAGLFRSYEGTLSERGIGWEAMLQEVERDVLPKSMAITHPLYLGLVNSTPMPGGILADLIVSGLNNNCGGYHQSPAMSAAEAEVVRAFSKLVGWESGAAGMVLPGGSFATLQGLQLARDTQLPQWRSEGPQSLSGAPRLYTSDAVHFSVSRAAATLGVANRDVVRVKSTGRGQMIAEELAKCLDRDIEAGALPLAVVISLGTTGTGAIDPIDAIATICAERNVWLHVDACYGGAALLLDELNPRTQGIERADSISIDPHKWFFVPLTCALLLHRHPDSELATFDLAASYIPTCNSVGAWQRGLPTSRRASGFTAWMALRIHGWGAVREAVRRNVDLSRLLEKKLEAIGFHVMPGGELSVVCSRFERAGASPEQMDAEQSRIALAVSDDGVAWFSTVNHDGRLWLRMNMVNIYTRERHLDALIEVLKRIVQPAAV